MSTTVTYKGNTITTATNQTRVLTTAGKYLEDDITLVDVTSGGSPTLQTKTKSYTPTESQQTESVTADNGYDGLQEVDITVGAISSSYVGSGITRRDGTDLSASGATVSVPSGYYENSESKSVSTMTLPSYLSNSSSGTFINGLLGTTTVQYLNIPAGYNESAKHYQVSAAAGSAGTPTATKGAVSNHSVDVTPSVTNTTGYITGSTKTGTAVTVTASELVSGNLAITAAGNNIDVADYATASVASGSATAAASISGSSATVSTGTNTITLSKTISNTPQVTAGYVSSGTAGNSSVSLTASVTTKAAATITPGTTNQTISSGTYLTGTQTISGDANLVAGNIKNGTTIFGVTGSYTGGGGGSASIDTKTVTASNRPSSLSFTSMKGQPIAWFLKATFTMTSSSSTYYYVDSMRYNGTNTTGRLFRMGSTRQTENVTSGYSYTYSGTTLTVSSTGNRTTSPGCFYNGSYELVYVY